jgi:hypothetical protein
MKRFLLFGLGVICIVALTAAGTPGFKHPFEFTLVANDTDPSLVSFTLAPRLAGALAGPGGLGLLEDPDWPYRTAIGFLALSSNTIGVGNTASGFLALKTNTEGGYNTASGGYALFSNTTGSQNTASGYAALSSNSTGYGNTCNGVWALQANISGYQNTASGSYALYSNTTGAANMASGSYALTNNTTGMGNSASGYLALQANTEGSYNTASGYEALQGNTTGLYNLASGAFALAENTTGSFNTGVGRCAGQYSTEGNYNIYLGAEVMGTATDTNTIRIGKPYDASGTPPEGQNQTFIAGIVENPISSGLAPLVVGITSDGRLGTLPSGSLPEGPVSGSLLFLIPGATVPAGYSFIGSTDLTLSAPGSRKPTKLTVYVYTKQ